MELGELAFGKKTHQEQVNRIKKTTPKLGEFWCHGCDRALISKGGKCPICGLKDKSKHKKK